MTREEQLEFIIIETIWMARRYADGRSTYAPHMLNEAVDQALRLGVKIKPEPDGNYYAIDGMLGSWDPRVGRFVK